MAIHIIKIKFFLFGGAIMIISLISFIVFKTIDAACLSSGGLLEPEYMAYHNVFLWTHRGETTTIITVIIGLFLCIMATFLKTDNE